jgi:hypothetical protein
MAVKITDFKYIIDSATNITNITNIIIKDYIVVTNTTKEDCIIDIVKLSIKNSSTKHFTIDISITITIKLINLQLDSLPRSSIAYFLKIIII